MTEPADLEQGNGNGNIGRRKSHREAAGNDTATPEVFERRLASVGSREVFYVSLLRPYEQHINLGNLQRMMLHSLQRELVEEVGKIHRTGIVGEAECQTIRKALSNYVSSIRDWELMVSYSNKADGDPLLDPFTLTTANPLDRNLMSDAGLISLSSRSAKRMKGEIKDDAVLPPTPHATRLKHNKHQKQLAFLKRLYMALFGGVALVGPMLLMVLYKHLLTSLLTVSISVLLFALAVATFSTGKPETVLTAVAAYAAVLVVFVGTSS